MTFSDVFATNTMTVYSKTVDKWGQPTFGKLGSVKCEYKQGGSMQRDDSGNEFVPASTFYPVDSSISISKGDLVFLGETSSITPPTGSEKVLKISKTGDGYFSRGDDIEVFTG